MGGGCIGGEHRQRCWAPTLCSSAWSHSTLQTCTKSSGSTPSFSFDFIIPLHSLPVLHHTSGSRSLLTQGGRRRLGNRECKDKSGRRHRDCTSPLPSVVFFTPPRGMGSTAVLFFSVSQAGLVLLSLFPQCGACSAACRFLFLCADVGAHFSKLKRRKPK